MAAALRARTVQPAGHGVRPADGGGLAGQEGVLGVVLARQVAAADGQDHGAVPLQEGGERGFILAGPEAFQQPAVAVFRGGCGTGQGGEMTEDGSEP